VVSFTNTIYLRIAQVGPVVYACALSLNYAILLTIINS